MHWVIAIVRGSSLEDIRSNLENVGIQAMTISECMGHGRQLGKTEMYRGSEYRLTLIAKARIEVACTPGELRFVIEAIQNGGRTPGANRIGDGKIFVLNLEECVRIRTGKAAI